MPDPDLEVIAKLISQDPGLSGSLLKIVNSPYYGLSNKIASIQRAVNLLGSRSIINLINAQSIKGEMNDDTIVTLNRFWDTAQDVAMTCLTWPSALAPRPAMKPMPWACSTTAACR